MTARARDLIHRPSSSAVRSMRPLQVIAAGLLLSATACGGVQQPEPTETPPAAKEKDDLVGEPSNEDLAMLRLRLDCEKTDSSICRGLAGFASARPPAGRPEPVSLVGVSAIFALPGSPDEGKPPVYEASYLVLSDEGARYGTVKPTNDVERADTLSIVRAILSGQPVPDNGAVTFARSRTEIKPATKTSKSLKWNRDTKGFVRETKQGVVVIESTAHVLIVGFFPH